MTDQELDDAGRETLRLEALTEIAIVLSRDGLQMEHLL